MSANYRFLRTYGTGSSSVPNIVVGSGITSGIFSALTGEISVSISGTELMKYSAGVSALTARFDMKSGNEIRFYNPTNVNYFALKAPTAIDTQTYTLPATAGTVRQVVVTDGAGVLSFGDPIAGSLRSATTEVSVSGATAPTPAKLWSPQAVLQPLGRLSLYLQL